MNSEKIILIVDDSEFDRSLLMKTLSRKEGFHVIEAGSGDHCVELVNSKKIDLILMDIVMPGAAGTEILKKIREKFNAIELPIIMITVKGDATDVTGSLQLGANDYITKPVNFDIAVSRIKTHLKIAEVSREMTRLQEIAALHAMVTTYNHEINNPLAIAVTSLQQIMRDRSDNLSMKQLEDALWRVADIVKKIGIITQKEEIQYEVYSGSEKKVKL